MTNVRRKDPSLLANRRGGRGRGLTVLARDDAFIAPAPPTGLNVAGRRAWLEFWQSDVSAAVDLSADRSDLEHWARCIDERHRIWAIVRKAPLIKGVQGSLILNPLHRRARDLGDEIQRISDRFGMNPAARFRLQLTVSEAGKSANELLKMLRDSAVDMPDVIELDDL